MYLDFTVAVPDIPGKITVRKMGRHDCVLYETGRTYDPKRKFNVPRRTVIGRRCADDPGRMVPNEKYLALFPGIPLRDEPQEAFRSSCIKTGLHLVIGKIVRHGEIWRILTDAFGDDAGLFLDLVSSLINGEPYPDFAFRHPLFAEDMAILGGGAVSRFLSGISEDETGTFLAEWNNLANRGERAWISCLSVTGEETRYALGVAYGSTRRVPLFYGSFPAPVPDAFFFQFLAGEASRHGCGSAGFVLTQGSFSRSALECLDRENHPFVIGLSSGSTLTASLLEAHRGTFESERACLLGSEGIYSTTVKGPLFEGDTRDRWLHLCFDPDRMAAERESLEWELGKIRSFIRAMEDRDPHDCDGSVRALSERAAEISRRLTLCGYFCLASSERMIPEEALLLCRRGEAAEKLFSSAEALPGPESLRLLTAAGESAGRFAAFVALILQDRMESRLKEASVDMGVPEAVRELERLEMVRHGSGTYRLSRAVTEKQRLILGAFGISGEDVWKETERLSLLLSKPGRAAATDLEEDPWDDGIF